MYFVIKFNVLEEDFLQKIRSKFIRKRFYQFLVHVHRNYYVEAFAYEIYRHLDFNTGKARADKLFFEEQ